MHRHTIVCALLVSASCTVTPPEVSEAILIRPDCPAVAASDYYYPAEVPGYSGPDVSRVLTAAVRASETGSLSCGERGPDGYRMLWLKDARPAVLVAIVRQSASWQLTAVTFAPLQRAYAFEVTRRANKTIGDRDLELLRERLQGTQFWRMPAWSRADNGRALWVIEGRAGREWHGVLREVSPRNDSAFAEAARTFLEIAGWPIPPDMQRGSGLAAPAELSPN
jgi:hypothetical protein